MTPWLLASRLVKGALTLLVVLVAAPYAWAPVYRFPEPAPFSGSFFYNPYANASPNWQRANFHAHGRAWRGITNGAQSDEEVARRYRQLGYDVPGVSNYQYIAAHHGIDTIPVYEHGYNVSKQHQLAIGAHRVVWLDFLLWQSLSHSQHIIDRLKQTSELVALAHPATRDAYTADEMGLLAGYDLIEVINGPFVAEDVWDGALSAGRAVWAIGNDDTHDLNDARRSEAAWNMVNAPTAASADITTALRAGRTYAVARREGQPAASVTGIEAMTMTEGRLELSLRGAPAAITFIGQNGAVRKRVAPALSAEYTWTDADTYIRPIVDSPAAVLYLNPVVRFDGQALPQPLATVDATATWIMRGTIALALAFVVKLVTRRRVRADADGRKTVAVQSEARG